MQDNSVVFHIKVEMLITIIIIVLTKLMTHLPSSWLILNQKRNFPEVVVSTVTLRLHYFTRSLLSRSRTKAALAWTVFYVERSWPTQHALSKEKLVSQVHDRSPWHPDRSGLKIRHPKFKRTSNKQLLYLLKEISCRSLVFNFWLTSVLSASLRSKIHKQALVMQQRKI